MPAYVDVAALAFVNVFPTGELDFRFLCKKNSSETIMRWIKDLKAKGDTKVLFSIMVGEIARVPMVEFVQNVAKDAVLWDVDGVDLDFEPFAPEPALIKAAKALRPALREALGREPLITAPVYSPWGDNPSFLGAFAAELDFLTTMDYTPWEGLDAATGLFEQYAAAIGGPERIALGVSCMDPPAPRSPDESYDWTPLADVEAACAWEPSGGTKKGVMLYKFSYDVEIRAKGGTGYPDFTFTETIERKLA